MFSYSLIPDSAYADLPEDPEERFLAIANIARDNYIRVITGSDEDREPFTISDWYQQYVMELNAAADSCGISGLIKPDAALGTQNGEKQFNGSLARILTRIKLHKWTVKPIDSAAISATTKQDIQNELESLRELVNSSNLSFSMKEALHKRIDAVEAELRKTRSSLNPIYALYGILMFAPPATGMMADLPDATDNTIAYAAKAQKLGQSIIEKVAAEKAHEIREEDRLLNPHAPRISYQPMKQLMDQRPSTALKPIAKQ